MRPARLSLCVGTWLALAALVGGCEAQRPLGSQCDLNSECNAPLVCRFDRCRIACNAVRDCSTGLACLLDEDGVGSCLLEDESVCTNNSECAASLVCRFGRCTTVCTGDRDCVPPTRCIEDPVDEQLGCFAGATPPMACASAGDCPGLQLCLGGRCSSRCLVDRDCGVDEVCRSASDEANNECVPVADGGIDAGGDPSDAGPDAGTDFDAGPDAGPNFDGGADGGAAVDAGPEVIEVACDAPSDCDAEYATTDCIDNVCVITACVAGRESCDNYTRTGCEADLSEAAFCGSCGSANRCAPGQVCSGPMTCGADPVVQLAAGGAHVCARRSSGQVVCWGFDSRGQLGDGLFSPVLGDLKMDDLALQAPSYPSRVVGLDDAISICAGGSHSCAVRTDGTVWCWGNADSGRIGANATGAIEDEPVLVSGLSNAVEVACGGSHTCARLSDGTVGCFGSNSSGQLGNDDEGVDSAAPVPALDGAMPLQNVVEISAGTSHTCARLADNSVRCWGEGSEGQLGNGLSTDRAAPFAVPGIADAAGIAAGDSSTCIRRAGNSVECFGRGDEGALGNGQSSESNTPVVVMNLSTAAQVAVGTRFACAALSDGTAACWGENRYGQTGDGGTLNNITPAAVMALSGATGITVGGSFACALTTGGGALCWGGNSFGQLGNGNRGCCDMPTDTGCASFTAVCDMSTAMPVQGL